MHRSIVSVAGFGFVVTLQGCSGGGSPGSGDPGGPKSSEKKPSAPAALAVDAGNGRTTLTWAASPGATSYRVHWSHAPIVDPAGAHAIEDVASPFVHAGLVNDRDHHYVVVAINDRGESAASVEVSAVPSKVYEPAWAGAVPLATRRLDFDPTLSAAGNGQRLLAAVQGLVAGERLEVGGGRYSVSQKFHVDLSGTGSAPIWIVAQSGETPVITRPDASQNTINIGSKTGAAYLCVRGLEFTGGDTAVKLYRCSDVWIDRCHIHDCGGAGIAANSADTDHLFLTRNEIHDTAGTAEGMYLGANNGAFVMRDSVIVKNHIHDCYGRQGDGIEIKQGSFGNWVAENEIHDCNYPCITVYGTGGRLPNLIERNVCYRSNDNVMQVQGDAIVRNNLLIGGKVGFQSHDHQGATRNLIVIHNTILTAGRGANLRTWGGRTGMVFANNVVYSSSGEAIVFAKGADGVHVSGNVVLGSVSGTTANSFRGAGLTDFVGASFDGTRLDATPWSDSAIAGAADPAWAAKRDVRGHVRAGRAEAGCSDAAQR